LERIRNNSFSRTLFINTTLLLIILLITVIGSWLWLEYMENQRNTEEYRSQFMQTKREQVQLEVGHVLDYNAVQGRRPP
jgi:TM2 domain-containing membrane protein YozV